MYVSNDKVRNNLLHTSDAPMSTQCLHNFDIPSSPSCSRSSEINLQDASVAFTGSYLHCHHFWGSADAVHNPWLLLSHLSLAGHEAAVGAAGLAAVAGVAVVVVV